MKNKILTNKLIPEFNFAQIDIDFMICEFSTTEKYIEHGALILDSNLSARSVVFESGRKFYALYNHSSFNRIAIVNLINNAPGGDKIKMRVVVSSEVNKHLLLQLFFNSINNPKDSYFTFNNITGRLFCTNGKLFIYRYSQGKEIVQIPCLEIKIDSDCNLNLNLSTFTSLALKDKIFFKKTRLSDYPKYKLFNNSLVRLRQDEKLDFKEIFIKRQIYLKKGNINLIDFSSYDKFTRSKCGILFEILENFNYCYSNYIKLNFAYISNVTQYKFDKQLNNLKNEKIKDFLSAIKINILDLIGEDYSKVFLDKFILASKELYPGLKITHKKLQMDDINIVLVHNKDYYDDMDPYENYNNSTVQHIALEDFDIGETACIENIYKELYIKNDIKNKKITLVDWARYAFKNTIKFGIKHDDVFVFIEIEKDGKFDFKTIKLNLFDLNEYQDYIGIYEDSNAKKAVEGIVIDGEAINIIYTTNQYTLPDFHAIGNELKKETERLELPKEDLLLILKCLLSKKNDNKICEYIDIIKNNTQVNFSRDDILNIINNKQIRQLLTNIIYEKYGKILKTYLRTNAKKAELFGSNIFLNHQFKTGNIDYYFVGDKEDNIKQIFPKSCKIRTIENLSKDSSADKLIRLMLVDFVRHEQLTVIPFPFKYLREYIKTTILDMKK